MQGVKMCTALCNYAKSTRICLKLTEWRTAP